MRHLPFGIAGDWHDVPLRVLAPQRRDRCMGKGGGLSMGLSLIFARHPTPSVNRADNGLASGVDVDVLDSDLLLTLAPVPVEGFQKRRVRP